MKYRLSEVTPKMQLGKNPEYNMRVLLDVLDEVTTVPELNKYYVFIYRAKTPRIIYDQHPFIVCTSLWYWGFIGFNYHWQMYRQYTWNEVLSNLHEVYPSEVQSVMKYPLARFKTT